jgi:hypothetical protein
VNNHNFSRDPAKRKAMELEADHFSAYIVFKLGASAEQAAYSPRIDDPSASPSFYPSRSSRVDAVLAVWNGSKSVRDNYAPSFVTDEIPQFQWPPPRPSAMVVVPNTVLLHGTDIRTLGSVAASLESVFEKTGYSERSFYSVPDGFALVSRMEQITVNGESRPGSDRWSTDMTPHVFSLRSYLSTLFTSSPCRYRVIAFIVSPT